MGIRKFRPVTPGQRHKAIGTFDDVTTSVPEKTLVFGKRSTGGRNNSGQITVRYRGGGHKRLIRIVDFKREKDGIPAVVKTIEYDPNRSARIALVFYADGEKRYIVAPNGLQVGATIMSGPEATPDLGNTLPLENIPVGTVIHNIELRPGQGAKMVRSAGNFAHWCEQGQRSVGQLHGFISQAHAFALDHGFSKRFTASEMEIGKYQLSFFHQIVF